MGISSASSDLETVAHSFWDHAPNPRSLHSPHMAHISALRLLILFEHVAYPFLNQLRLTHLVLAGYLL